jgi:murein DD-endopeptidase MepM/ murein hydrolase activator NlpD
MIYKRIWLLTFCILISLCAQAHSKTRVYVYNNTLSDLEFNLRQTNTALASQYWSQGERSIPATKAHEILSIDKSGGVKNNKTYGFEFDVSDGTNTFVLKIRIEGKSVGRETFQSVENRAFSNDKSLKTVRVGDRNVSYRKEGSGNFMFVVSDLSKKLFRFPVQDRTLIEEGTSALNPLKGPLSPDMRTGDRSRGIGYNCLAFDGSRNPPHCYSNHKGTDYMLKDGFKQMDRPGNFVVAAREGTVVKVVQNLYDRCKAKPKSQDTGEFLQPDCNGNNGPDLDGNTIIIDHGDDVYTEYYHLKKNSSLVAVGDSVSCGQPIARIGSSGYSTAPHLHFEVQMCKEGKTCATYASSNLITVNPYNGTYTGRGYWQSQGSGRIPSSTCATGQSVWQGEPAPAARGCKSDDECGPGSFCNKRVGQENRCLIDGSLNLGNACYKNKECKTGKCQGTGDDRMCVCAKDSDCRNGLCIVGTLGVGKNYCRATVEPECPAGSGWSYEVRNPLNKDRCNRTVTKSKPLECKLKIGDKKKNWTGPHAQRGEDECRSVKGKKPRGVKCPGNYRHTVRSGADTCSKDETEHETPVCPIGWDYKSQNGRDVCQDK